jgi:hypothetical protein
MSPQRVERERRGTETERERRGTEIEKNKCQRQTMAARMKEKES